MTHTSTLKHQRPAILSDFADILNICAYITAIMAKHSRFTPMNITIETYVANLVPIIADVASEFLLFYFSYLWGQPKSL